ncbi:acyltransferase family protein [Pseudomonas brassicacearum]|uniref:acyltransferase family protein n=1 Tax=Pseudomonas brassicacearum TaxID=930166 RepID=UPI0005B327EC|nr:acyltransferase [Pseudomonas brassicacearum]
MLGSIQLLRAFAAWIVVFHHYIQIFYGFNTDIPAGIFLAKYGAIGVDIFFVISGFVIFNAVQNKYPTPLEFAKQRLFRIVPAYWLFTAIVAASIIYFPSILYYAKYETVFTIQSMLFIPAINPSGMGMLPLITVGWTLNYEMAFYAVFFLALFAPKRFLMPLLLIGIFTLQYALPKLGGTFVFYGRPIVYEFLLGVVIAEAYRRGLINKISFPLAMIAIASSILTIWFRDGVKHDPVWDGIPCALIIAALISLERYTGRFRIANKLGDWSYSTYLCHPIITFAILNLHRKGYMSESTSLFAVCTLVLFVSWASYTFIERPIVKASKRNSGRLAEASSVN